MGKAFEVGKRYFPADSSFEPILIVRRTAKTVLVDNGTTQWKMRIRKSDKDCEYVTDSSVPMKWRGAFTYSADWEVR